MVQTSSSAQDLIAAFDGVNTHLDFDLPDPEDQQIPDEEFEQQLDTAWQVCDRFDLQTDIWRGRILKVIRDREKRSGEGRGSGFSNWLKDREISKSQAYSLIELANSADTLLSQGNLEPSSIKRFSKRAFVETAKSSPEVQKLVTEAANEGDRITRREVRQLSDEWTAMSSELIPAEVKEKATSGSVPTRYLAPLVKELGKLPESHISAIQEELVQNPDVETLKQATSDARNLSRYLDAAGRVQALSHSRIDLEMALEEALRLGCLNTAADILKQAAVLEEAMVKLYNTWKRVANLADRLYVDTGASTPNLRHLLSCLERLSGEIIEIDLGERDRHIRLQILNQNEP